MVGISGSRRFGRSSRAVSLVPGPGAETAQHAQVRLDTGLEIYSGVQHSHRVSPERPGPSRRRGVAYEEGLSWRHTRQRCAKVVR